MFLEGSLMDKNTQFQIHHQFKNFVNIDTSDNEEFQDEESDEVKLTQNNNDDMDDDQTKKMFQMMMLKQFSKQAERRRMQNPSQGSEPDKEKHIELVQPQNGHTSS